MVLGGGEREQRQSSDTGWNVPSSSSFAPGRPTTVLPQSRFWSRNSRMNLAYFMRTGRAES